MKFYSAVHHLQAANFALTSAILDDSAGWGDDEHAAYEAAVDALEALRDRVGRVDLTDLELGKRRTVERRARIVVTGDQITVEH